MAALVFLCSGCFNTLDDLVVPTHELPTADVTVITEGRVSAHALAVANEVLHKNQSRSVETPEFAYVLNTRQSRSVSLPDTLACVVNYPNEGGFVIVANDPRVESVLAYSDTGSFSFDNEIAKVNFIDKIGAYIEQSALSPAPQQAATASIISDYFEVAPISKMLLGQWEPWNKYVVKHKPGWPVGCVAVAAATVMTYSRRHLEYKGSTIRLDCLETAIVNKNEDRDPWDGRVTPSRPNWFKNFALVDTHNISWVSLKIDDFIEIKTDPHIYYGYTSAVDQMAEFLYQISADLKMRYETNEFGSPVSVSSYGNAYDLLKDLKFSIHVGVYTDFDHNVSIIGRFYKLTA